MRSSLRTSKSWISPPLRAALDCLLRIIQSPEVVLVLCGARTSATRDDVGDSVDGKLGDGFGNVCEEYVLREKKTLQIFKFGI